MLRLKETFLIFWNTFTAVSRLGPNVPSGARGELGICGLDVKSVASAKDTTLENANLYN